MNETTELIMKQLNAKKVHAETHQVGGGDEIDVTKLKNVESLETIGHSAKHELGGSDEIDVMNLRNVDNLVTKTGDFQGTWNGVAMTSTEPGLSSAFNALKADTTTNLALKANQADLNTANANIATNTAQIASVSSGSPKGVYATLTALQTAYPTGNTNIYVVTADGKWYYWNGSAWTAGGVYQSTGIADGSVGGAQLKGGYLDIDKSWNIYNKANALDGKLVGYTPNTTLSPYADAIYSGLVPVETGKSYVISQKLRAIGAVFFYDVTVSSPNFNTGAICSVIEGAGGPYGTWGSPTGKVTRVNNALSADGYYSSVITITDPGIKYMAWHMHSGSYWTHTTADFNALIDSAQVEAGTLRTQYTTYGWEIYKIAETAMPDQFKKLLNNDIVVLKKGTDITARVSFTDTKDLYHWWKFPKADANLGLNLESMYTCDITTPYDVIAGDMYKNSGDDVTPIYMNQSYMGANHGYFDLLTLTATGHGKTTADIGSVWNLTGGTKKFIIVDVINANTLKIFSDYSGNPIIPTYYTVATSFSGTLTHVSGATNVPDITFSGTVKDQFYPNTNNKKLKIVLDGKEISVDGVYYGDKFDIVETYNIVDIPSVQQYLKDHIGTKANLADDSITGAVTVTNIFSHGKNGSLTVKTGYQFLKQTDISFYGVVQSVTVGAKAYVPDVGIVDAKDMSTVVTQGTNTLDFAKSTWLNATKPPYRYHQFSDDLTIGMALGYNTSFGVAKPTTRQNVTTAGNFVGTTKKMYPYAKAAGSAVAGDYQETIAFRVPLRVIDSDATCLYWYWVGKDIYLAFDYHKNIDKIIDLPSYMAGKKVEQLDVHANTTIQSEFVSAKGIKIKVINGYGFAVLRLYD